MSVELRSRAKQNTARRELRDKMSSGINANAGSSRCMNLEKFKCSPCIERLEVENGSATAENNSNIIEVGSVSGKQKSVLIMMMVDISTHRLNLEPNRSCFMI